MLKDLSGIRNQEILQIALQQSAYDCNCQPEDFLKDANILTISKTNEQARKYLPLPFECDLVSYGSNIVAQTSEEMKSIVSEYMANKLTYHCFETPHIYELNDKAKDLDARVCFMAEYFLPDMTRLAETEQHSRDRYGEYEIRILEQKDFSDLYIDTWSNALCSDRKERELHQNLPDELRSKH